MENISPALSKQKPRYGIDAPGVVRNLFIAGLAVLAIAIFFPVIKIGGITLLTRGFIWSALFIMLGAFLMLFYSLRGKLIHRDRMLNLVNWGGDEQVLDIGTGKGLLMIGAARRLTTGKATGIDIWNAEDLTGNNYDNAINNAIAENVRDKVLILNENAMQMSFADDSFDVIITNQVIHNIYNKPGRLKACQEISRVLKPGGTALISDFRHMNEYQANFNSAGLETRMLGANYLTTYPPLKILVVKKHAS